MDTPVGSHWPTATPLLTNGETEAQRGEETCSSLHSKSGTESEQGPGLQTAQPGAVNEPFFQTHWVPHLLLLSPAPTEGLTGKASSQEQGDYKDKTPALLGTG